MKLKLTLLKSIVSVISGIITDYLIASLGAQVTVVNCSPVPPLGFIGFTCQQPTWIEFALRPMIILISIIVMVLVYFIWSFTQKK